MIERARQGRGQRAAVAAREVSLGFFALEPDHRTRAGADTAAFHVAGALTTA
ncbi:hypothetical protein HDA32_002017 [Spinactinospora alkalitolerans]|uniref:Uncharacterized protein n=1 Tax=Spinactinospora alkalitolerans TaxID=687207 RepID=A0A852TUB8_9ACTN|nr:hypothetical protein [Spinactinospora alkalitolerans]NYE46897.1 hypothetical protein [Spinactinospora alkalitolerans]